MIAHIPPLTWIISSVLCSSSAHFFLKLGATRIQPHRTTVELAWQLASNGWLLSGMVLHVVALGLWVLGLQRMQLSVAYPFIALGFVLIALVSWLYLKEPLNAWRLAGMACIVVGVMIVART